ncbi:hypothetical protein GYO_3484 [Bacillus spizizenii TU-B-10]|uniref:Uncharacterized protein n=1 Tax=Bacillus spizizenii (strain DSM 15029 / JCM 12233 / NBRC 101239 / NRRL B-23049 / TU-B-10) TaxID=1052585 RepID=G4P082_BACS4|nr:hypothetical protein GYO_3484 [Bacillus spizizenii TU-B-10]
MTLSLQKDFCRLFLFFKRKKETISRTKTMKLDHKGGFIWLFSNMAC